MVKDKGVLYENGRFNTGAFTLGSKIAEELQRESPNQLLKDKRDRKIPKAIYYAGLKRLASPNLRAIWKEFHRLCGLGEFKARRRKRYYKFDACHLLPIISTPQALAVYASKYISKGFE